VLGENRAPPLGHALPPLPQFLQTQHLGLVGVDQPLLLAGQPFELALQLLRRATFVRRADLGRSCCTLELRHQPLRLAQ